MKIESVAIVGAGSIGGTVAFGLLANEDRYPLKEILLVDMSKDITQAQVLDLSDGSCKNTIIRGSTFKEAGKCDLIILTANTPPIEKEPQDKLLLRNQRFIHGVATSMQPIQPNAFVIVAVEPVDVFVDQLRQITPLRIERIMGTGHVTVCYRRFRRWFEEYQSGLKMSGYATEPWVIGTAKDPVVIWPEVKEDTEKGKGGQKNVLARRQALEELKKNWVGEIMFRSNLIIEKKGDTWFGPSASAVQLANTLLNPGEDHSIETVICAYHPQFNVCTSFPAVVNNQGLVRAIDIHLTDSEKDGLISMALDRTLTY